MINTKQIKVIKFLKEDHKLYLQSLYIRRKTFIEEQNVPENIEVEFEDEAHYYLALAGSLAIATARWRITARGCKLERFATLSDYRGKGAGKSLLLAMLNDVCSLNKIVYLHAQEPAIGFYRKYGFQVEGEAFYEAGIRHFAMRLNT